LPLDLLDAFRSTLEELHDADLLIHLVDISVPEYPKMLDIVEKTLVSLGLNTIPRILVFNKVDLVNEDQFLNECFRKNAIAVSALSGYGLGKLTDEVVLSINGDRRLG
jgi:GTP-binding protein HflX